MNDDDGPAAHLTWFTTTDPPADRAPVKDPDAVQTLWQRARQSIDQLATSLARNGVHVTQTCHTNDYTLIQGLTLEIPVAGTNYYADPLRTTDRRVCVRADAQLVTNCEFNNINPHVFQLRIVRGNHAYARDIPYANSNQNDILSSACSLLLAFSKTAQRIRAFIDTYPQLCYSQDITRSEVRFHVYTRGPPITFLTLIVLDPPPADYDFTESTHCRGRCTLAGQAPQLLFPHFTGLMHLLGLVFPPPPT